MFVALLYALFIFLCSFALPSKQTIKAPLKQKVRLYRPHKGQLRIHNSKARFRVVACGRRFGKTLMACNEIVKFALEHRNATCAWVAPSYRQSKIAYRLIRRAMREVITYKSDSELRIEFKSGSSITFYSSDNYDALRGNGFHFIVLDECADINELAWTEVLQPTLADTNGKALFIGTPKGRNFFFRLFARGEDEAYPDWESFHAATADNPYIRRENIEAARRELPEDTFAQEYLAVFLEESAGVFKGIDAIIKGLLNPDYKYDPKQAYSLGWDPAKYNDFSVITLMDAARRVVAWTRINELDYTVQLKLVAEIANKFHAHVLMDMTGVGDPLLEQLKQLGYKTEDDAGNKVPGFHADGYLFTNASKQELVQGLQLGVQHRDLEIPDIPVLVNEMRIFQYELSPSRKIIYSAPKGYHDDCVISLALAYEDAKQPRGPLVWSVDETKDVRTLEMTELPENKQYQIMEVEKWEEPEDEGYTIEMEAY